MNNICKEEIKKYLKAHNLDENIADFKFFEDYFEDNMYAYYEEEKRVLTTHIRDEHRPGYSFAGPVCKIEKDNELYVFKTLLLEQENVKYSMDFMTHDDPTTYYYLTKNIYRIDKYGRLVSHDASKSERPTKFKDKELEL